MLFQDNTYMFTGLNQYIKFLVCGYLNSEIRPRTDETAKSPELKGKSEIVCVYTFKSYNHQDNTFNK